MKEDLLPAREKGTGNARIRYHRIDRGSRIEIPSRGIDAASLRGFVPFRFGGINRMIIDGDDAS